MTKSFYPPKTYQADHSAYGGFIYPSDFNTNHMGKSTSYGSAIAKRIANDKKFDEQCRKNIVSKQNYGGTKNA